MITMTIIYFVRRYYRQKKKQKLTYQPVEVVMV